MIPLALAYSLIILNNFCKKLDLFLNHLTFSNNYETYKSLVYLKEDENLLNPELVK